MGLRSYLKGINMCNDNGCSDDHKVVCKHCKVQMMGRSDFAPILGKEHKKNCPRKRMYG